MCGCLSHAPYWGPGLAHNPSMCPEWELQWRPFGSQTGTQSTEPHQPGPHCGRASLLKINFILWKLYFKKVNYYKEKHRVNMVGI